MKSENGKDILLSKTEIKYILNKKFINSKVNALKLNIKAFNISNYKKNLLFKGKNKSNSEIDFFQNINYQNSLKNEFVKIKLKNEIKINSYKNIREKNNTSYKFIYNNTDSSNNLKKYTNNSPSFQNFNELLKNSSHNYSVNKIEKSILLKTPIQKNKYLNLNGFNSFKNKENKNPFIILPPIKFHLLTDLYKTDLELLDKVDNKMLENEKLIKKIRISLLQDINPEENNYKLYLNYLKPITNYFNYHQDIYMIPHIKNNFSFCQNINNFDILSKKLCNKNILHKKVVLSMNRIRIIRELLIKEKENERKQIIEEIQQKPILKWKNYGETKLKKYEKKFAKYELQDSFEKCTNNQIIRFADKKLRNIIYSKKYI